ncbi:hypothetical protein [Allosphingosinicella sp.]|uniref:hypothetical protein n=1 Tax=Allosphingosinicella sp. TaxID=2823234 RepID=UPI003784F550
MNNLTIAEYSKPRVLARMLGPFLVLTVIYLLFGSRSLHEVFSPENLWRSTPWRPVPVISLICIIGLVGIVMTQIIAVFFLGKKFVRTDGQNLFVAWTNEGPLEALLPERATVHQRWLQDRVEIPRKTGRRLIISTPLSSMSGSDLLAGIVAAVDRSKRGASTSPARPA